MEKKKINQINQKNHFEKNNKHSISSKEKSKLKTENQSKEIGFPYLV